MSELSTTRMSSKGQVVIPENIRKQLNLTEGTQFVVVGKNDVVMLKTITAPDFDSNDDLFQKARQQAKEAGMKRSEIASAIKKVRGNK